MVRQEQHPKQRFSSAEIVEILMAHQRGTTVSALCRQYDISPTTFYKWRAKFSSQVQSEPEQKQLALLEDENLRLKQLLGEAMLENSIFRERLAKKRMG